MLRSVSLTEVPSVAVAADQWNTKPKVPGAQPITVPSLPTKESASDEPDVCSVLWIVTTFIYTRCLEKKKANKNPLV